MIVLVGAPERRLAPLTVEPLASGGRHSVIA